MDELPHGMAGRKEWKAGTAMHPFILENVYALNRSFLEHLVQGAPSRKSDARTLAEHIALAVAGLDAARRLALAHVPVALFDARFGDSAFWKGMIDAVHEPRRAYADPASTAFKEQAILFGWYLCHLDSIAARLHLGMAEGTREAMASMPVTFLHLPATLHPGLLAPRWDDRFTIWRILLGAARRGPRYMGDIAPFLIQVMAGDLALEACATLRAHSDHARALTQLPVEDL